MPGIMDNVSISGSRREANIHMANNGISSSIPAAENDGRAAELKNRLRYLNGASKGSEISRGNVSPSQAPPELVHITQGFFPFAQLVNRAAQQCWNDLLDLITELADVQTSRQVQAPHLTTTNGKPAESQSTENTHKKIRILDFGQAKRAEFIKLLVLSQWSRQAIDVSKLVDLQAFIRTQHQAYYGALQRAADMKKDLVRAQTANPDLRTALEVLSRGRVVDMSDLGYKPPKALTAKRMLQTLRKINNIISTRLILHDPIPQIFRTYRVHDGRVTFVIPGEFEIDLSIAEEHHSSQFFFIDIHFLFSPSSPIPKGRFFNEFDLRINDILRREGLVGCSNFLHNLTLTNKITILLRQALALARGNWFDTLHVELLHRTLIVQYWTNKPGSKSWLEIGIKSGHRKQVEDLQLSGIPQLGLRWIRENKEVDSDRVWFDIVNLSMESILRSTIALHASYLLHSTYNKLNKGLLYATCSLSLKAQLSPIEPGDCLLDVQLTRSRDLHVSIEPMSGAVTISITPSLLSRLEGDRNVEKTSIDDIASRVSRLRCVAAMEEIESNAKILGWDIVNHLGLKVDARRIFPPNVLRCSFFGHRNWEQNWIVAATSSMDGDDWWLIRLRPTIPTAARLPSHGWSSGSSVLQSACVISGRPLVTQQRFHLTSFRDLEHALAGILAIYANACYLAELGFVHSSPSMQKLQLDTSLKVPSLFVRIELSKLPSALQILPPTNTKKLYTKETIRLSFQGFDRKAKAVIIVAYGQLRFPIRNLGTVTSKMDDSVVFQPKGGGFAMRFIVNAGKPMIPELFDRIQRLEFVLSIFESLQHKKINPRITSLSRISFDYGIDQGLSASILVKNSDSPLPEELEPSTLQSQTKPPCLLRMGIALDLSSPHRRIKESLASALNQDGPNGGLGVVIELLTFTLPLHRVLDHITACPSHNQSCTVHVTARNAKSYQIRYPALRYRFAVVAGQHRDQMRWILRDMSPDQERPGQANIANRLRDMIFNSRGDGWKGLGRGAVADPDKIGNLILELHSCVIGIENLPSKTTDGAGEPDQTDRSLGQQPTRNGPGAVNSRSAGNASRAAGRKAAQDPITID